MEDSASALDALYESLRVRSGLAAADALEPNLDALCTRYVLAAFIRDRVALRHGQDVTTQELALRTCPAITGCCVGFCRYWRKMDISGF